jgi:Domain of unknown function (DUF5625)
LAQIGLSGASELFLEMKNTLVDYLCDHSLLYGFRRMTDSVRGKAHVITRFFRGRSRVIAASVPEQDAAPSYVLDAEAFQHQDRFLVDFNASRMGATLHESFRISRSLQYALTLAFAPSEHLSANDLSGILRTKKILISKYDSDSVDPTQINLRNIMKMYNCSIDDANTKLWEGVNDGSFTYRIVDRRGVIPLWAELKKFDETSEKVIFSYVFETSDVVGQVIFGEGAFGYERKVTPIDLEPGFYTIAVKTLQDTPELQGARIKFGLSHG